MFNGKGFHDPSVTRKPKKCLVCETEFTPKSGANKFCSTPCKGKWKYITGQITTDSQYELISGNWNRYLSRLLAAGGEKRSELSREILFEILEEQNYKCALSGVELTCELRRGERIWTNASVDRIEAGGPYVKSNIQLVCRGLNSWRSSIPVDEFIWWCEQVANFSKKKGEENGQL